MPTSSAMSGSSSRTVKTMVDRLENMQLVEKRTVYPLKKKAGVFLDLNHGYRDSVTPFWFPYKKIRSRKRSHITTEKPINNIGRSSFFFPKQSFTRLSYISTTPPSLFARPRQNLPIPTPHLPPLQSQSSSSRVAKLRSAPFPKLPAHTITSLVALTTAIEYHNGRCLYFLQDHQG